MKEDSKENYIQAFSMLVSVFGTTALTAVSGDPFSGMILGSTLSQLLSLQASVKQKRVLTFFDKLERDMLTITDKYDISQIDKIATWDLIEMAMVKASRAKNEEKIDRFKNIVKNQIVQPTEFDYIAKFLSIADALTEKQLLVTKKFVETQNSLESLNKELTGVIEEKKKLEEENNSIEKSPFLRRPEEVENNKNKIKLNLQNLNNLENHKNSLITEREEILNLFNNEELHFMTAELVSLGLIYNPSSGRTSDTGEFKHNQPTGLAIKFIVYLKE